MSPIEELPVVECYFYGVWSRNEPGHFLRTPDGFRPSVRMVQNIPWRLSEIDGGLAPGTFTRPSGQVVHPSMPKEGEAFMYKREGWTFITFWDRSGDARSGSNSGFIAKGDWTFEQMLALFKRSFPTVVSRFLFQVVYSTHKPFNWK